MTKNWFSEYWVISEHKVTAKLLKIGKTSVPPPSPQSTQCYITGIFSIVFELIDSGFRHLSIPLLPWLFGFFRKDSERKMIFNRIVSSKFNQVCSEYFHKNWPLAVTNKCIFLCMPVCVHILGWNFLINLCQNWISSWDYTLQNTSICFDSFLAGWLHTKSFCHTCHW